MNMLFHYSQVLRDLNPFFIPFTPSIDLIIRYRLDVYYKLGKLWNLRRKLMIQCSNFHIIDGRTKERKSDYFCKDVKSSGINCKEIKNFFEVIFRRYLEEKMYYIYPLKCTVKNC